MKIKIFITLLLFLFIISANAQRFKGGVLVGMNACQIDGDTWSGFYKAGFMAGAFVNTHLQEKFGAQLEIKYSSKGSAPHSDSWDYPRKIRLNYVDVPIIGTFQAIENLKLEAGLSINYLFKAEYFDGAWFNNWDLEPNSMETSILFGINYKFFTRFDLNLRWNYSLFPIRTVYSGSSWGEGAWYNHVINFGLYFYLGQD
jgi:hypothetical protein